MLALDSIMVSKCPRVYRTSLFLMTCLNMLLKFDHLVMEYAVYSIKIPVQWGGGDCSSGQYGIGRVFLQVFWFCPNS